MRLLEKLGDEGLVLEDFCGKIHGELRGRGEATAGDLELYAGSISTGGRDSPYCARGFGKFGILGYDTTQA